MDLGSYMTVWPDLTHGMRLYACVMISKGLVNDWWENVLYSFIENGKDIHYHDVKGTFWTEIDYLTDYIRLQKWTEPKSENRFVNTAL